MRVVGGAWRGRPLKAPAGRATRPTSDKVREAVFDVLEALLRSGHAGWEEQTVLDLFAGSGALGIEALSRGAARCTFVERARPALAALRENLARVGGDEARMRLVAADARRALQADAAAGTVYTLVFVDPPYARYAVVERDLARLLPPLLAPGALVVVETAEGRAVESPWRERRVKVYGDTKVVFLEADA